LIAARHLGRVRSRRESAGPKHRGVLEADPRRACTIRGLPILLTQCGSWPGDGISRASYQDAYVCSPLVARLLIDTM
ncbi:hypothetical protein, partial [Rhodoplanes sp. SY1]|uniref:hypothetical protein n=1 Tax=Rhodoplanes sp. SY1 TaxID=3166646 RepID=UPI0038B62DAC